MQKKSIKSFQGCKIWEKVATYHRAWPITFPLVGIIMPYNFYYWYFLLRLLVREIFAGPFHQAKTVSSSFTVMCFCAILGPIATPADKYPFLLSRHGRVCSGHEEKLHQMYLSLLKWKFKGNKKTPRQILLFNQIRKLAKKVTTYFLLAILKNMPQ